MKKLWSGKKNNQCEENSGNGTGDTFIYDALGRLIYIGQSGESGLIEKYLSYNDDKLISVTKIDPDIVNSRNSKELSMYVYDYNDDGTPCKVTQGSHTREFKYKKFNDGTTVINIFDIKDEGKKLILTAYLNKAGNIVRIVDDNETSLNRDYIYCGSTQKVLSYEDEMSNKTFRFYYQDVEELGNVINKVSAYDNNTNKLLMSVNYTFSKEYESTGDTTIGNDVCRISVREEDDLYEEIVAKKIADKWVVIFRNKFASECRKCLENSDLRWRADMFQ